MVIFQIFLNSGPIVHVCHKSKHGKLNGTILAYYMHVCTACATIQLLDKIVNFGTQIVKIYYRSVDGSQFNSTSKFWPHIGCPATLAIFQGIRQLGSS